jgi:uncharacterized protein (DUF1810 family)
MGSRNARCAYPSPIGHVGAMTADPFDLERFVAAQDAHGTYHRALDELRGGNKTTHWMWFVFPQVAGLGSTATAVRYAVGSLTEARAYLAHPVLGRRLLECVKALCDLDSRDPVQVLGGTDAMKLRSSMTLFAAADPAEPLFRTVLEQYFDGAHDERTRDLLR